MKMAGKTDKQALWISFTRDAMARYVLPEDISDADELVDDMVDVVTKYADSMLDEYEDRFERGGGPARRKRSKKIDDDDDDED